MTHETWDGERIAAAFVDRFDRPAPRELSAATIEQIRVTSRRPRWWPSVERPSATRLVSGIAVVAVLAILLMPKASTPGPGIAQPSATGSAGGPGQPASSPYQSFPPSPAVPGFPLTVIGLDVRSVADAQSLLANPITADTELAVAGWYSARDQALPCPYQPTRSPVAFRCVDVAAWLSGSDRAVLTADASLDLRFIDPVAPIPGTGGPRNAMVSTPLPVVLIGHFHDERSVRCETADMDACQRAFVVDASLAQDGTPLSEAPTPPREARLRLSDKEASQIARDRLGASDEALAVGLEQGGDAPWFTPQDPATKGLFLPPWTWFIRGYWRLPPGSVDPRPTGTPVAGWLAIDDATGLVSGTLLNGVTGPAAPVPPSPIAGFPPTVHGLPVMRVFEAIARDSVDDRPVAVAGWLSQIPPPLVECAPVALRCGQWSLSLSDTNVGPPGDASTSQPSVTGGLPAGRMAPVLLLGGPPPPPANADGSPRRVVVILHRGDLRADRIQPGDPVSSSGYVVDQFAWIDGVDQPRAIYLEPGIRPRLTPETVLTIAGPIQTGQTWTYSISAVRADHLASIGVASRMGTTGIAWVIRMTGNNPLDPTSGPHGWGTIVVDDATGNFKTSWTDGP